MILLLSADFFQKSVQMITIWHHEACRVMEKGDPWDRFFFYPIPTQIMGSFSCSPSNFAFLFLKQTLRSIRLG